MRGAVDTMPEMRRVSATLISTLIFGTAIACAKSEAPDAMTPAAPDAGAPDGTAPPDADAAAEDAGIDGGVPIVDLTATLEMQRALRGLPALGAAVWRGEALIALGASGVRKDGALTSVTATDAWHLGSCTKAMTGTLIGVHVDRGAIGFDDTLEALLPGENIHAAYRAVTIEQLLRHRGGAPGAVPQAIWAEM